MIITVNDTVFETETTLNDLIVIGEHFDIDGYRVYQLDWWGINESERKIILEHIAQDINVDIDDYINWYDMKLLRNFKTAEFTIMISDFKLNKNNLNQIIEDQCVPIWKVWVD